MHETILSLTQSLTGAAESEQSLLGLLCTAAEREWESRLREGMTPSDCGDAFPCAAAFAAAANLLTGRGGSTVASFTAGSVSASEKSAAETNAAAAALRGLAARLMIPYTAEDTFCFHGVRT